MSVTTPQFNTETIGSWGDPDEFTVERDRIKAYATATNDPIGPHAAGELAPPVFAIVPAFGALAACTTSVIPGDYLMMVLHGEQDFHFHAPIRPDTTLVTRAMPVGVQPRSSGVTVTVKGETRDKESDELLVEQYMMSFVRGAEADTATGDSPPGHAFEDSLREREPDASVEQTFDEDQTFRYSEAAGDPMPIHLDDEVAKAMGLPGIIIHGLCTMAFTSVAAIEHACPDDPERLKRLAVRFSKTVQPKQAITTRIWDAGDGAYAYETTSDSGDVVIKDGLAEVANGNLDGRIAVITGAGRGIGREHALLFASEGAKVVVNDLGGASDGSGEDASAAQAVVDEITAAGGEAVANHDDVSSWDGAANLIREGVDAFGQVDILVNNAGILRDAFIASMTEEQWDAVLNVHLKGHFCALHHAVGHWRDRSKAGEEVKASVINTASASGTFMPNAGQANYGAAKAGIAALALVAAQEVGRYGVRVNAIAPVARTRLTLQTPGPIGEMMKAPDDPEAFDAFHPKHVSPLVAYLASEDCGITGKLFMVQGGAIAECSGWQVGEAISTDSDWTVEQIAAGSGARGSDRAPGHGRGCAHPRPRDRGRGHALRAAPRLLGQLRDLAATDAPARRARTAGARGGPARLRRRPAAAEDRRLRGRALARVPGVRGHRRQLPRRRRGAARRPGSRPAARGRGGDLARRAGPPAVGGHVRAGSRASQAR